MKNKVSIWLYFLGMIAGLFNAYFSLKQGNSDATLAWLISSGLAGGALGAHLEIKQKNDEQSRNV